MAKVRKPLAELFNDHYLAMWGARWSGLRSALCEPPTKVKVASPFNGAHYELDSASLVPPRELGPEPGDKVLDLCAAPGGKALMMVFATHGKISLTVNELSRPRFQRLKAVMHDYLPSEVMNRIDFNCGDGALYGLQRKNEFDKVLVDAPCSGERHILQGLGDWTPSRSKQLSVRQHSLLCSALDATRRGGVVVYSTCAISPIENDGVIRKLLKSRKDQFEVVISEDSEGEATEFGRIYLPDIPGSGGPIYCAKLIRLEGAD